jgi:hypothetical protein
MSDTTSSSTTEGETLDMYSSSGDDAIIHEITIVWKSGCRISLSHCLNIYSGWEPPYSVTHEEVAVRSLLDLETSCIKNQKYGDAHPKHPPMRRLFCPRLLRNRAIKHISSMEFLPDGVSDPRFLRRIPFQIVWTGGYQDIQQRTVGSDIWI